MELDLVVFGGVVPLRFPPEGFGGDWKWNFWSMPLMIPMLGIDLIKAILNFDPPTLADLGNQLMDMVADTLVDVECEPARSSDDGLTTTKDCNYFWMQLMDIFFTVKIDVCHPQIDGSFAKFNVVARAGTYEVEGPQVEWDFFNDMTPIYANDPVYGQLEAYQYVNDPGGVPDNLMDTIPQRVIQNTIEISAIDAILGKIQEAANSNLGSSPFVGGWVTKIFSFMASFMEDVLPEMNPEITYGFSGPDINMQRSLTAWVKVRLSKPPRQPWRQPTARGLRRHGTAGVCVLIPLLRLSHV